MGPFTVRIRRFDDDLGFVIPAPIVRAYRLKEGQEMLLRVESGPPKTLVVTLLAPPRTVKRPPASPTKRPRSP